MSGAKLHPIYAALENFQYSRAIKLCLALPSPPPIAQALLAHAYVKSGQRYKSLLVMQGILGTTEFFPELQLEIKYAYERREEAKTAASAAPAPDPAPRKAGKKGKKKGGAVAAPSPAKTPATKPADEDFDLVDQLSQSPTLPEDWDKIPPPENAPTDETLLQTMSMTMTSLLRLPLTAYQLNCWAASKMGTDEHTVRKAFLSGFAVLVSPQYEHLSLAILANMQVLALQLARVQQQQYGVSPATSWAAQTALWQIQFQPKDTTAMDAKTQQRLAMLPRLAESLASKAVGAPYKPERLTATEDFLLYLRTLEAQDKFKEQVEAIDQRLAQNTGIPPNETLLQAKVEALLKLKEYSSARSVVEELLDEYPDDWRYWKQHLACAGDVTSSTEDFLASVVAKIDGQQYPVRGPYLMRVELAKGRDTVTLLAAIKEYGNIFAGRTSAVFSDLKPYLEYFVAKCSEDEAKSLIAWAREKQTEPASDDDKKRRTELRSFIFGVQVTYVILAKYTMWLESEIPPWQELVRVWKSFESSETKAQAQKESRPADDLILLAVQQLLKDSGTQNRQHNFIIASCLLESAIQCSPHNAYLKITAMFVYGELNAVSRSWKLFKALQIKHIQHESCAFLILPLLQGGALYGETISVCKEILRLQTAALRDASDYAEQALENGTLIKAEEFIVFHREKMNKSLTTLEAKGLILDSAPFIHQEQHNSLGLAHGIVGGEGEQERAGKMVSEVHNISGAFSLLELQGSIDSLAGGFVDNRDFDIFSNEILISRDFESSKQVVANSLRRGHHHRLLIESTLCVEATKGPKKGKVSKCTVKQEKRCRSLLACVKEGEHVEVVGAYRSMLEAMHSLCCAIACFGAGVYADEAPSEDTLETREQKISSILVRSTGFIQEAIGQLDLRGSPSVPNLSRFLCDCMVPAFALCRMSAKVADLYGWGPRRQKTKACAAAVSGLAAAMISLADGMKNSAERDAALETTVDFLTRHNPLTIFILLLSILSDSSAQQSDLSVLSALIDKSSCDFALSNVKEGQETTRSKICEVLDNIASCLGAFVAEE